MPETGQVFGVADEPKLGELRLRTRSGHWPVLAANKTVGDNGKSSVVRRQETSVSEHRSILHRRLTRLRVATVESEG